VRDNLDNQAVRNTELWIVICNSTLMNTLPFALEFISKVNQISLTNTIFC
jgi:hypothetical protein